MISKSAWNIHQLTGRTGRPKLSLKAHVLEQLIRKGPRTGIELRRSMPAHLNPESIDEVLQKLRRLGVIEHRPTPGRKNTTYYVVPNVAEKLPDNLNYLCLAGKGKRDGLLKEGIALLVSELRKPIPAPPPPAPEPTPVTNIISVPFGGQKLDLPLDYAIELHRQLGLALRV